MRAKELRKRSDEELQKMLTDTRAQLFRARLDNATHQLDKTSKIPIARREIARINTIIAERKRVEALAGSAEGSEE